MFDVLTQKFIRIYMCMYRLWTHTVDELVCVLVCYLKVRINEPFYLFRPVETSRRWIKKNLICCRKLKSDFGSLGTSWIIFFFRRWANESTVYLVLNDYWTSRTSTHKCRYSWGYLKLFRVCKLIINDLKLWFHLEFFFITTRKNSKK